MLPIIIPELQNRSVIAVVRGTDHFGALTSSGKLLTWGSYSDGALGLGDPGKLPVRSPGGYAREDQRMQGQAPGQNLRPPGVKVPSEVRFDHGLKGRVERYCFATTARRSHTAALVFDVAGDVDEIPPEDFEQHFRTTVPRSNNNQNSRIQTTRDKEDCCLM